MNFLIEESLTINVFKTGILSYILYPFFNFSTFFDFFLYNQQFDVQLQKYNVPNIAFLIKKTKRL